MRAFVTGAGGFLGRHLVARLARDGHDVVEMGGDLFDAGALDGAAAADVVFHLAAVSFVPDTLKDPENAVRVNVLGTDRALAATRKGRGRFCFVSSSHVYGPPAGRPLAESDPLLAISPYAATKIAGEALVSARAATHGLATTVFRPFNMYGAGQREDFLLPTIAAQARAGDVVKLGDVTPVRDFVHVDDAVDLMARAALDPRAVGETFNVASGRGVPVREAAEALIRVVNPRARLTWDASRARAGDPSVLVGSVEKARRLLGWEPRVALEDGLRRTFGGVKGP